MPKKTKKHDAKPDSLWIAPHYSLKGPRGESTFENRSSVPPSNNRYLELADIALGLKKPAPKKRSLDPMAEHSRKARRGIAILADRKKS